MTREDLKLKVINRFEKGDKAILKTRDREGKIVERIKVTIIEFYPSHILVERKGYKESYTYWDFIKMTSEPGEEKRLGRHPRESYKLA